MTEPESFAIPLLPLFEQIRQALEERTGHQVAAATAKFGAPVWSIPDLRAALLQRGALPARLSRKGQLAVTKKAVRWYVAASHRNRAGQKPSLPGYIITSGDRVETPGPPRGFDAPSNIVAIGKGPA